MSHIFIRCTVMLACFLCSVQATFASDIMVMNAFARASLTPVATSGVIYLSIMNHGAGVDRLVSMSTPDAKTAEVHETILAGDVMQMRALEGGLKVEASTTVDMKPGGLHIMLMGLQKPLKKGDVVALNLRFEKAGEMTIQVPVGDALAGHNHTE